MVYQLMKRSFYVTSTHNKHLESFYRICTDVPLRTCYKSRFYKVIVGIPRMLGLRARGGCDSGRPFECHDQQLKNARLIFVCERDTLSLSHSDYVFGKDVIAV